ncbi:Glucosaminyl phosphatidylinositol (GlcN-PI) nositol acylation protein [Coniosporium apollinis]|uniref:GPI-anchored wall transfer protein n=2 Tax=Coniosporium TaxID=2810619 RepID=A0ABQ9P1E1_9PEZI|nr:Glucosaminyl phosphatidylinositol (GlcN-PI) nositol acylation protein [Cladosporium sp. JES 115]KAJ9668390.1 Glucosaminyl phosphatidylinositol (GlcN-PI) nositol acylation protein [Coniosporium apollinis]
MVVAANGYKAQKEAFVSNLTGGTVWEINTVTLVAPTAVLLWSVLQSRQRFFVPYTPAACLTDFLLNCAAILFATTLYSSIPLALNLLLLTPAVLAYFTPAATPRHAKIKPPGAPKAQQTSPAGLSDPFPIKPFVTAYRGTMMVITCVAILAVDFRVFPRRFGKVENWGTSLMDLGVGSFVFSSGLVSARSALKERTGKMPSLSRRLITAARHSLPLLVLGFVRLYSVKGLDYAEHVTEYGVHWNFFFTLGLLPPFVALFQSLFSIIPSYAALALLLGIVYEAILGFTDLKAFILTAPRTDLLSKNREGIFSFFGYLAIFLAGQATGMYVLPREETLPKDASLSTQLRRSVLGKLVLWSVVWTSLFAFSTSYYGLVLSVSRRLANLPYFLWVAAFNCGQLALFCAIERFCFPNIRGTPDNETERQRRKEATSRILHAFNRNGLAVFLLANLLTGLVNLSLPTLSMGHLQAMAVLLAYIGLLAGVALILDSRNISIKL